MINFEQFVRVVVNMQSMVHAYLIHFSFVKKENNAKGKKNSIIRLKFESKQKRKECVSESLNFLFEIFFRWFLLKFLHFFSFTLQSSYVSEVKKIFYYYFYWVVEKKVKWVFFLQGQYKITWKMETPGILLFISYFCNFSVCQYISYDRTGMILDKLIFRVNFLRTHTCT